MSSTTDPGAGVSQADGQQAFTWRYLPELDGLRAIAVLLVFGFHVVGTFYYLPNGWLGVDVFFVLSGFLITSLLVAEQQRNGHVNLRNFYVRRALRLVPALLVLLVLTNIFGFIANEFSPSMMAQDSLAAALYVSNWVYAFDGLPRMYLQHTWSLAVEEQYYLLWAVVVVAALARRVSPVKVAAAALAVGAASAIWRFALLWPLEQPYERAYFGFDARLDGLLLGSALGAAVHTNWFAAAARQANNRSSTAFLAAALVIIAGLARFGFGSDEVDLMAVVTVVNVLTAAMIIAVMATPDNPIKSMLSHPWAVAVGRRSYGIYLYHILAIAIIRHFFDPAAEIVSIGALVLTFAMAAVSYRLVEAPALQLKHRFASGVQP